jgi:hypothetical protein
VLRLVRFSEGDSKIKHLLRLAGQRAQVKAFTPDQTKAKFAVPELILPMARRQKRYD